VPDEPQILLRQLRLDDYRDLRASMQDAYAGTGHDPWSEEEIQTLIDRFPDGQLCIEMDGKVAASALSLIVDYEKFGDRHTFLEITGNGTFATRTFATHDSDGDVLYGIEVFVHPDYRGMRLGRRLYDARKELCENLNLRSIMAGGRIPNYDRYARELSPRQYIDKVRRHEIPDPVLTFQLSNDFHVRKILQGYDPIDQESRGFATLLEWNNIYYEEKEVLVGAVKEEVRIGVVQWQMRLFPDLPGLLEQVEYFVDAVSDYGSDFCVLPEYFNAPLMAEFNELSYLDAIRGLAGHAEPIRERLLDLAMKYNVNIVGGAIPELDEAGRLQNVSFLCRRDGTWEAIHKIHPTPDEQTYWGMRGGDDLRVIETDAGRIGILICYDVEFPELSRLLAEEGLQILFVPFQTDTQNGFNRVRICARARAIENECYVVIAGSVGNLPRVHNMDIQYAQSAVFTPSDFAFPENAVKAQATPNTETTLIVDVNLAALKELHNHGSVRNLHDRRLDLYEVRRKRP
jgi:predicted amidohydrolase/ribosomal protein S18 acetylase RimI-like enzyme